MPSPSVSRILLFKSYWSKLLSCNVLWWPLPFKLGKKHKQIIADLCSSQYLRGNCHDQTTFPYTAFFHCFVAVIITEKKGKSILFISTHSEFSCLLLSLLSCFLFYELFKALDRLVELEQFSGCCYPHLRSYYLIGSDNLYLTKFIRCKDIFFQPVFESCGYFLRFSNSDFYSGMYLCFWAFVVH